ncbi:MAG TPA: tetrathionate reductase subunit B, partial [Pseudomonas sp.]|nr:tetrathionate reductase subunit B [Pseudomonas sp.]
MSKSDETPSVGRRGLLKDLLGLSAAVSLMPLASSVQAGVGDQPPRRPGIEGKRYGMLVDLRKCIGCQACTVS